MAQVSKKFLRPDVWERIFNLFLETISGISNKNQLQGFLAEFLTPTERIVLAKRLAIAVLLAKGHDYSQISKLLHVTPPTIAKVSVHLKYEGEGLKSVMREVFKRQAMKIIWEEIKSFIEVPPMATLPKPHLRKNEIERDWKIETIKEEF